MKFKKITRRISSLKLEIKWVFSIAFGSIIIIELILKNWNSPNSFIFHLGDIYLKICFSIVAATIFYFLNQHLPREDKKIKSSTYFNNRLKIMASDIEIILRNAGCEPYKIENITGEIIVKSFRNINPTNSIKPIGTKKEYKNWKEFLDEKLSKIKLMNDELLTIYDLLDNSMLENILTIANGIHMLQLLQGNLLEKPNLNDTGSLIRMIVDSQRELNKSVEKLSSYLEESQESFRKRIK